MDDEQLALTGLVDVIKEAIPNAHIFSFKNANKALDYSKTNFIDIAFLDVMMKSMNGLELGKCLKDLNPNINIIFVTGYSEFALDAYNIMASGYIVKPISKDDILYQMDNLRHPINEISNDINIYVKCFGNFEVFLNDKPVKFNYTKTKEMFAYLIDRNGTLCAKNEIMAVLWEDKIKDSYFQNVRRDLLKTLSEDIFEIQKGLIGINKARIKCDYYSFLEEKKIKTDIFEYMSQYSWAESSLKKINDN